MSYSYKNIDLNDISITPSELIEHIYCARYTYFMYVLCIPQYEEKYFKVLKGRELHEYKEKTNIEYLRKRICVKNKYRLVYLSNDYLRGEIDEILELSDGTMAPLDYKFAEYKDVLYNTYKVQSCCYAILIEENFNVKVNKGYIVFIRSCNKLIEFEITDNDKQEIKNYIKEMLYIIQNNKYPKGTNYKQKCSNCTYKNLCTQ